MATQLGTGTFAVVDDRRREYADDLASQQRRVAEDRGNLDRPCLWAKWRIPILPNGIEPTNELLEVMLDALIAGANVGFLVYRITIFNLPGASNNGGTKSILGYASLSPAQPLPPPLIRR